MVECETQPIRMVDHILGSGVYDQPGGPLVIRTQYDSEESRILDKLIGMTYEDMLNGKMEEL